MRNLYHPKHQQRNEESGAPRQNQQTTDSTRVTRQQMVGPVSKQRIVMSISFVRKWTGVTHPALLDSYCLGINKKNNNISMIHWKIFSNHLKIYCGWLNFRGVPIFVVFVDSPIHEFQYPRISDFLYKYEGKYHGHEFWTPRICHFRSNHEIGTHENKAIHSIQLTVTVSLSACGKMN